eukprot:TRINITY_DN43264_c0_g1_i1.p1 TRINITY_DN43264_c0_g1~~TRINITY_DN43264_c0_g1_i1.p1  ORF type:complete len:366 (+),score=20.31 TRINITY_DN43264_c0_g1_i1:125-1099(+)
MYSSAPCALPQCPPSAGGCAVSPATPVRVTQSACTRDETRLLPDRRTSNHSSHTAHSAHSSSMHGVHSAHSAPSAHCANSIHSSSHSVYTAHGSSAHSTLSSMGTHSSQNSSHNHCQHDGVQSPHSAPGASTSAFSSHSSSSSHSGLNMHRSRNSSVSLTDSGTLGSHSSRVQSSFHVPQQHSSNGSLQGSVALRLPSATPVGKESTPRSSPRYQGSESVFHRSESASTTASAYTVGSMAQGLSQPRTRYSSPARSSVKSLKVMEATQAVGLEAIISSRQVKYDSARKALSAGDNDAARALLLQCASDSRAMTQSLRAALYLSH